MQVTAVARTPAIDREMIGLDETGNRRIPSEAQQLGELHISVVNGRIFEHISMYQIDVRDSAHGSFAHDDLDAAEDGQSSC